MDYVVRCIRYNLQSKGIEYDKKWIFDKALEDNMITYYAYTKSKEYFKDYWTCE